MKTAVYSSKWSMLTFLLLVILLTNSIVVYSQEATSVKSPDLSSQFNSLKTESESFNDYKVIKTYNLNAFWKTVEDSLKNYRVEIATTKTEIKNLSNEINSLNNQLAEVKATLEESESKNNGISVFGILFKKSLYNFLVWTIIAGLLFLSASMFIAFKNNLISTKKSKKDFHDLHEEFESYRKESRDKQMKLGRELQTERNKLEEYKDRVAKKEKAH